MPMINDLRVLVAERSGALPIKLATKGGFEPPLLFFRRYLENTLWASELLGQKWYPCEESNFVLNLIRIVF